MLGRLTKSVQPQSCSKVATLHGHQIVNPEHDVRVNPTMCQYTKLFASSDMLEREYTALEECRSPYVQRVLDIDWEQQVLTLEYDPQAVTLSHFSIQHRWQFFTLLPSLITAIRHCHRQGWIHGDIKPSNILYVQSSKAIRLIDFGASYRKGSSREALDQWHATPMFSTRQKLRGEGRVSVWDDWFALSMMVKQVVLHPWRVR